MDLQCESCPDGLKHLINFAHFHCMTGLIEEQMHNSHLLICNHLFDQHLNHLLAKWCPDFIIN